ncbi:DUF6861 domain-containing protein [Pseudomonas syringae]|uniref:DUF6861 domain-containing protein n=1 Tax=Pseudomonas syringae TaxID=317 RepID=UPI0030D9B30E
MAYQGGATYRTHSNERVDSIGLKIRRVSSVRTAFIHAEWEAGRVLRQRYADLDISSVLNDLMSAVSQMAMIVAGSVLTGGAMGLQVRRFRKLINQRQKVQRSKRNRLRKLQTEALIRSILKGTFLMQRSNQEERSLVAIQ